MPLYTPGRRRAIVILLLTSVLLLTLDLRGNAVFDAARTGFSKLLEPFETAADVATRPISNAWHGITNYEDLAEENERLRDQLDAQRGDQVAAQAAIQDHQELLALNNLASLGDYTSVVARVVGESPNNFDQVFQINKGSNDGIEVGMAVIAVGGLVGKVTAPVLPDQATVMLLTDARYAVGVKVVPGVPETTTTAAPPPADESVAAGTEDTTPAGEPPSTSIPETTVPPSTQAPATTTTTTTTIDVTNSRETGQLRGRGGDNLPQVDLLADTPVFGRFADGDIVLTSGGDDGLAPPDIPVGVVTNVVNRSAAEGPLLEIEPLADLGRLHFVRIVLYKPASEVEQPTATEAAD